MQISNPPSRSVIRRIGMTLGCLLMLTVFMFDLPAMAQEQAPWWNQKWSYRRPVSVSTGGVAGAEQLANVPVLLRLHTGNFNFAESKPSGEDIVFVDSQNQTVYPHRIELYDMLEEIAYVWVQVPRLGSGPVTFWMYYGNPEAAGGGNGKVYDNSTVAAFNFAETEGLPQDSTSYANNASSAAVGQGFASIIGRGVSFNGVSDQLMVAQSPSLAFSGGLSASAWVRVSQPQNGTLFALGEDNGLRVYLDGATVVAEVRTDPFTTYQARSTQPLAVGEAYTHVAVTVTPSQGIALYLNGQPAGTAEFPEAMPEVQGGLVLGANFGDNSHLAGEVDEFRLSNVVRAQPWFALQAASQGPKGGVAAVGQQEIAESGSVSLYYLTIIFENITSEAWAIIGILLIISIASWLILLTKAFVFNLASKENKDFNDEFEELDTQELLELTEDADDYKNSVVFPIYAAGCREISSIKARIAAQGPGSITASKATSLVEKAMERQYIQESQKLNAYLVVMTIAISGGPFLGLLGTVWGVMNTFAALTIAGEASLTAIAPGIASSLLTTVFGLIVAIPALFGYNYLVTKIKGINLDMIGFMDMFVDKAEEQF